MKGDHDRRPPRDRRDARPRTTSQYEAGLRPRTLDDYIGQDRVRENLHVSIAAAQAARRSARSRAALRSARARQDDARLRHRQRARRGHPLDRRVRSSRSPATSRRSSPTCRSATCSSSTKCTACRRRSRRSLYPAMEDYELDIMIGQGPGARSVKMPVQPFTLIGATTRTGPADVAAARALRHRASARLLQRAATSTRSSGARRASSASPIDDERPRRSRGARAARRASPTGCCGASAISRRCAPTGTITARRRRRRAAAARGRRARLRRDRPAAAAHDHRQVRRRPGRRRHASPRRMSEEKDAIEDIYEPFLIQIGFLDRTPRGRVATAPRLRVLRPERSSERIACGRDLSRTARRSHVETRQDRRPVDLRAAARADQRRSRKAGRDHRTNGFCSAPASASATSSIPAWRRPTWRRKPRSARCSRPASPRPTSASSSSARRRRTRSFRAPPACCSTRSARPTRGDSTSARRARASPTR